MSVKEMPDLITYIITSNQNDRSRILYILYGNIFVVCTQYKDFIAIELIHIWCIACRKQMARQMDIYDNKEVPMTCNVSLLCMYCFDETWNIKLILSLDFRLTNQNGHNISLHANVCIFNGRINRKITIWIMNSYCKYTWSLGWLMHWIFYEVLVFCMF